MAWSRGRALNSCSTVDSRLTLGADYAARRETRTTVGRRRPHAVSTITSAEYAELGHVTNTPRPVVNNGVLVTLDGGSEWTVTGTSYLSRLSLSADSAVTTPAGGTLSMTVDGVATAVASGGDYSGAITLTVS